MDRVRAMLEDSGLSKGMWAEAAVTACHIRHRSPAAGRDKTPWESFYNKKPDVSGMRIFGAQAFALVPKELRRKLDNRSEQGRFVGYPTNTKGFKILLPSGKVIVSADVVFAEGEVPSRPAQQEPPDESEQDVDIMEMSPESQGWADPQEPDDPGPEGNQDDEPEDQEDNEGNDEAGDPNAAGPGPDEADQSRYPARVRKQTSEWWRIYPETAAAAVIEEPQSFEKALGSEQADEWRQAMDDEMKSLHATSDLDHRAYPKGHSTTACQVGLKVKRDANGNIERFKARLVAKGFRQKEGVDFNEVFAPVSKYSSLRALLAVAAVEDLEVHQLDIKTAFLNGILEEEVYIEQPAGYKEGGPDLGCHFHKALYGLKQAPRAWHIRLVEELTEMGLVPSAADRSWPILRGHTIRQDISTGAAQHLSAADQVRWGAPGQGYIYLHSPDRKSTVSVCLSARGQTLHKPWEPCPNTWRSAPGRPQWSSGRLPKDFCDTWPPPESRASCMGGLRAR